MGATQQRQPIPGRACQREHHTVQKGAPGVWAGASHTPSHPAGPASEKLSLGWEQAVGRNGEQQPWLKCSCRQGPPECGPGCLTHQHRPPGRKLSSGREQAAGRGQEQQCLAGIQLQTGSSCIKGWPRGEGGNGRLQPLAQGLVGAAVSTDNIGGEGGDACWRAQQLLAGWLCQPGSSGRVIRVARLELSKGYMQVVPPAAAAAAGGQPQKAVASWVSRVQGDSSWSQWMTSVQQLT